MGAGGESKGFKLMTYRQRTFFSNSEAWEGAGGSCPALPSHCSLRPPSGVKMTTVSLVLQGAPSGLQIVGPECLVEAAFLPPTLPPFLLSTSPPSSSLLLLLSLSASLNFINPRSRVFTSCQALCSAQREIQPEGDSCLLL